MMPITKMNTSPVAKLRSMKIFGSMNGFSRRQQMDDEHPEAGDGQAKLDPDLGRGEPVGVAAAVEHQLQRADAERQHGEAEEIETARALGDARQIGGHAEEGEDADRQVDEEHPAPVEAVGQPAAQRRPDDRADHDAGAPDGHGLAVALLRIDVEQEGLRQRHDRRAEHALQQAEQRPCSPGSRRCRRASR